MNCTEEEQKAALRLLGTLLKNNDFSLLNKALKQASSHGHPNSDYIKHCFYTLRKDNRLHQGVETKINVPPVPEATRGLSHYDAFFKPEVTT